MQRYLAVFTASRVYGKLRENYTIEVKKLFDEKLSDATGTVEREELILAKEKALTHKTDLRRSARLGVAAVAFVVKGYIRGNLFPSDDVLDVGTCLEQIVSGADIDDEADDEKTTLTPLQYKAFKTSGRHLIANGELGLEELSVIDEYNQGKSAVVAGQKVDLKFGRLLKEGKFGDIINQREKFRQGWEQKIGRRGIAYWLARTVYDGIGGKSSREKEIVADHLGNCGQLWQIGDDIKDLTTDTMAFDDPSAKIVPANSIVIQAINEGLQAPTNSFKILLVLRHEFDNIVGSWYRRYEELAEESLRTWSESGIRGSDIYASGALDYTSHKVEERMNGLKTTVENFEVGTCGH